MTDIKNYKKIIVIGSPGSGKSTFSVLLSKRSGLPLIHLDKEYWHIGWVKTKHEEWIQKQNKFISSDKWIIDGNYGGTLELRFAAADLIIFLDINRLVCLFSAAKRVGKQREDMPQGLVEPGIFSKNFRSFVKYIWCYPRCGRKEVLLLHEKYPQKAFLHIKNRRELASILPQFSEQ